MPGDFSTIFALKNQKNPVFDPFVTFHPGLHIKNLLVVFLSQLLIIFIFIYHSQLMSNFMSRNPSKIIFDTFFIMKGFHKFKICCVWTAINFWNKQIKSLFSHYWHLQTMLLSRLFYSRHFVVLRWILKITKYSNVHTSLLLTATNCLN